MFDPYAYRQYIKTKKNVAKAGKRLRAQRINTKRLAQVGRQFAARLEANATEAEKILYEVLQEIGIDFRFQVPLNTDKQLYIPDFVINTHKDYNLVVELDGAYHKKRKNKDRSQY